MAKDKKVAIKYYRLRRPFFNGKVPCEAGSIEPFPEGNQPSGATLVTPEDLKAEAVVKAAAQDTFITAAVAKYVDEVLPELVAEAVETALAELETAGPTTAVSPLPSAAK